MCPGLYETLKVRNYAVAQIKSTLLGTSGILLGSLILWPHFRPRRHLLSAADNRQVMADRFAVCNQITAATTTAAA